ncbi:MAG: hypothetical protein A2V89_04315 [Gammaproteobacteria bacterium RBG_16_37_9]|nr:MAG: hypothetical protein A2V89_04315 [Gammaproteobacteria bacterium RBG_16_37_9]
MEPTKEEQLNRKLNEAMEKNTFIETYSEVPIADCLELLAKIEPAVIIKAITADLGKKTALTCEKLRDLDEPHCVMLLEHYFAFGQDKEHASQDAALLHKMLQQNDLFSKLNQNNRTIQNINSCIYKTITESKYKFDDLKKDLSRILSKISDSDPALGAIKKEITSSLEVGATMSMRLKPEREK